MSDTLWLHGLYSPWNSPSQNTGVCSHPLLQQIFLTQELNQGLLHCRQILYQLSYQGSPFLILYLLLISFCFLTNSHGIRILLMPLVFLMLKIIAVCVWKCADGYCLFHYPCHPWHPWVLSISVLAIGRGGVFLHTYSIKMAPILQRNIREQVK